METKDLLRFLVEEGIQWVQSQREVYRTGARTLSKGEKNALSGYFNADILGLAQVSMADKIGNPDFYASLKGADSLPLLDFTGAIGITYIDTIVLSKHYLTSNPRVIPILFHELVHIVQCHLLGLRDFVELYIGGWAENSFNYYAIPLEVEAYRLSRLYEKNPKKGFSVLDEVQKKFYPKF